MKSGEARMLNRMMQQEAELSLTSGGDLGWGSAGAQVDHDASDRGRDIRVKPLMSTMVPMQRAACPVRGEEERSMERQLREPRP